MEESVDLDILCMTFYAKITSALFLELLPKGYRYLEEVLTSISLSVALGEIFSWFCPSSWTV